MDMSLVSAGYNAANAMVAQHHANSISRKQAEVANAIRAGNNATQAIVNKRLAVQTGLQRWRQNVNNSRVMEAGAADATAAQVNFNRQRDARTRGNFSTNVRDAEELGRQQASAAASGITGSVVDVIDRTSRVRQGMAEVQRKVTEGQIQSDFKLQESLRSWATLDALDNTVILDTVGQLDYGHNTAQTSSVLLAGLLAPGVLKEGMQGLAKFEFDTYIPPDP